MKSTRAVTLLELLLAATILALAILPVIQVFFSASQGLKQTLPYYQAVFLSEKVAEDLRVGAQEDPYFPEQLVREGLGARRGPVVRGGHPFFEVVEDTAPPFGRIEPGVDAAILPELGPLYAQVEPLGLALSTTVAESAPDRIEERTEIAFDWIDTRAKEMAYHLATPVLTWTLLKRIEAPGPPMDDATLGKALDPASGRGLAAMAGERGADVERLGDLGRLLVLGGAAEEGMARDAARLAVLRERLVAVTTPGERALLRQQSTRLLESTAASLLSILQSMRGPLERLAGGFREGALGTPPPDKAIRWRALDLVRKTFDGLQDSLANAMSLALEQTSTARLNACQRAAADQCLLRVAGLVSLTTPWRDRKPLKMYLQELKEYYRGREPHRAHAFSIEAGRIEAPGTGDPVVLASRDVLAIRDRFFQAGANLVLLGR